MATADREEGPARRRRREVRERIEAEELAAAAKAETATLGRHDEPQHSGAVVAVNYGDYRSQELFVRSGSNIGAWYPLGGEYGRPRVWVDPRSELEKLSWHRGNGPAPRPGPDEVPLHPHWEDVLARGPVTLLVAGQDEARAAGWAAGRRQLMQQIEELAEDDE